MLFPSTLFISSLDTIPQDYLDQLGHKKLLNNPDILIVNDYSIENIRSLKNFLSRQPYSHDNKIILIPHADLLSSESQNTLLKSLEEPGENNYFVLITSKPGSLLPTIVSRCQQIRDVSRSKTDTTPALSIPKNISEKLALSESLAGSREETLKYLSSQIAVYQKMLLRTPDQETSMIIGKLIKAVQMVNANIDSKSVFDFLFLS